MNTTKHTHTHTHTHTHIHIREGPLWSRHSQWKKVPTGLVDFSQEKLLVNDLLLDLGEAKRGHGEKHQDGLVKLGSGKIQN